MSSGKQIIDGIYKLCYNIRIICGANGKVAFLSSKANPAERLLPLGGIFMRREWARAACGLCPAQSERLHSVHYYDN